MYPLDLCKKEITTELQKILAKYHWNEEIKMEIPPEGMGDLHFPVFPLPPY